MAKMSKKKKEALQVFDKEETYSLQKACEIVKEIANKNFDESVDLAIELGVDPRKSDQMVRGSVNLPHGTGKDMRVLALCNPDKQQEAKDAGADHVGLEDYIEKIKEGWTDVDVVVTTPDVMPKVGQLGKVLGPRGLMPNPKTGTVTMEIGKAVEAAKAGKIDFKVDKYGIVHATVGKSSFDPQQLQENAKELINTVVRNKPSGAKGTYLRGVHLSSTMSPGIQVEAKSY
jgi:large subunit ribosomal protein L1